MTTELFRVIYARMSLVTRERYFPIRSTAWSPSEADDLTLFGVMVDCLEEVSGDPESALALVPLRWRAYLPTGHQAACRVLAEVRDAAR